jgi:hypothetical protein
VEAAAKKINYDFSGVDAPKNDKDVYGLALRRILLYHWLKLYRNYQHRMIH